MRFRTLITALVMGSVPLAAQAMSRSPDAEQQRLGWPLYAGVGAPPRYQASDTSSGRFVKEMADFKAAMANREKAQAMQQTAASAASANRNYAAPSQQAYQQQPNYQQATPNYQAQAGTYPYQTSPYGQGGVPSAPAYSGYNQPGGMSPIYNPSSMNSERASSERNFNRSPSSNWHFSFGAGLGYMPKFESSTRYRFRLLPIFDIRYGDKFFINSSRGAGINIYDQNGFKAGPFLTYNFGRDEADAYYLKGSGDIKGTFESGVFVEKDIYPFLISWNARYATFNRGHGGMVSDLSLIYQAALQPNIHTSFGGSLSWASKDYMDSFFSVNSDYSLASGLRTYQAKSGFKDIGLDGSLVYSMNPKVDISINGSLKRLVGNAARSPITKMGSERQFFGGTGVIYHF